MIVCCAAHENSFSVFFLGGRRIGATYIFHEFFFVPCTHLLACFCSTCFPTAAFEMFSFDCDRKKSCVCVCSSIIHTHSLLHSLSFLHSVVVFLSHRIQLHQLRVFVCFYCTVCGLHIRRRRHSFTIATVHRQRPHNKRKENRFLLCWQTRRTQRRHRRSRHHRRVLPRIHHAPS